MKRNILIAAAFAAVAALAQNNASAQSTTTTKTTKEQTKTTTHDDKKKSPEKVAQNQAGKMKEKLSLTDKQTSQVEAIFLANLKDKNKNPDADTKLMHKQTHDDVNKLLTPEQQKKWKELREEKEKENKTEKQHSGK